MRKVIVLLLMSLAISIDVVSAQQVKEIDSKLQNINSIIVDGNIVVSYVNSPEYMIKGTIKGANVQNFTYSVIDGSILSIKLKNPTTNTSNRKDTIVNITVHGNNIENIKCKRGACFVSNDVLKTKILTVDASRSSVVGVEIDCQDVTIESSTSSSVKLTGKTTFLVVNGSYSSHTDCRNLLCESVTVEANTDARCFVNATKKLLLTAKTNAKVFYKRETDTILSKYTSIAGVVEELKEK